MSASFDAYKIFYYVGKYNNITHAAGALFLSQSTVSRSIQSLESDLGCKLMERSQQGVILTLEGELLYSHVARAYEEIMLGEERIRLLHSEKNVCIRLGADNYISSQFILPLMKDFQKDFPDVRVEISSDIISNQEQSIQALLGNEVDAVFTLGPIPDSQGIISSSLGEYSDVFIAGRNFSTLAGNRLRIYDISLHNFVALNRGICGSQYLSSTFAMHGLRVEPSYKVEDIYNLLSIVDMGLCLALVPSPLFESFKHSENIFALSPSVSLPKKNICILTAKNTPQTPARDELIKRIKKTIQGVLSSPHQ